MMARTKRDRRAYSAGEWGRNRVRVFPDPKTGMFQIEWRENGRRLARSLKQRSDSGSYSVVTVEVTRFASPIPADRFPPIGDQIRTFERLSIAVLSWTSSACW